MRLSRRLKLYGALFMDSVKYMTLCHRIRSKFFSYYNYEKEGDFMIEMAAVLGACIILIVIAYEYGNISRREWGENSKSFF